MAPVTAGGATPSRTRAPRAGRATGVGLTVAIVAGAVAPFLVVVLLPSGSRSAGLALVALAFLVAIPALIVAVVRSVLRDARDSRASAAALGAALGWAAATRAGRPAFVGVHRGRSVYVTATVRLDPERTDGRPRFNARPVVRVGIDGEVAPDAPEGVDLPPRGATLEDVRRALDLLVPDAPATEPAPPDETSLQMSDRLP